MPFAGHPMSAPRVRAARAGESLGRQDHRRPAGFEEKAGLVPLDLTREQGTVVAARASRARRRWRWATRSRPRSCRDLRPRARPDRDAHPPAVIASCGNNFVFAEVTSRAACNGAARATCWRACADGGAVGIHLLLHASEQGVEIQSRHVRALFGVPRIRRPAAPRGVDRPAGPLQARAGARPVQDHRQGFDMGRPNILQASAEKKAAAWSRLCRRRCVPMLKGTIDLT